MTQSGGAQALQASGRSKSLAIGGGEGTAAAVDQIRKGTGEQACAGQSVEWEIYSAVDAMIRIFDKQDRMLSTPATGSSLRQGAQHAAGGPAVHATRRLPLGLPDHVGRELSERSM